MIRYTVRIPQPHTHYAEIEAIFPTDGQAAIDVFLAVWTPGSYMIREYSRNIEAANGTKIAKNRWRIETGGAAEVTFPYRVYCREMSVRTNWIEADFALLNGAPTFVTLADRIPRPHQVTFELPPEWKTAVSGLLEVGVSCFLAADYDTLVDSPIVLGNPDVREFEVDGIPHYVATIGAGQVFDTERAATGAQLIVRQYRKFWGSLPYSKYVFLNVLTESSGGLEHRNSMCIMGSRWAMSTPKALQSWLGLVSHEFLHVWNVKRLHPAAFDRFDYENENYTHSLWIVEGLTEYYADLMLCRAGLLLEADYFASLSRLVETLESTPGRLTQSVAASSFDAWIKLYRPDENSINTTISYYVKGAVIGWLLDAQIRMATGNQRSLDDLMRLAYERFDGISGYTEAAFRAMATEIAGTDLAAFFHHAVDTAEELDYSGTLDFFGLRMRRSVVRGKAWLGAETKVDAGRLLVARIPRGTPAAESGLNVDDEILGVDGYRVRADAFAARLDQYRAGEPVELLVARRERILTLEAHFAEEPGKWQIEPNPQALPQQLARRTSWLQVP